MRCPTHAMYHNDCSCCRQDKAIDLQKRRDDYVEQQRRIKEDAAGQEALYASALAFNTAMTSIADTPDFAVADATPPDFSGGGGDFGGGGASGTF